MITVTADTENLKIVATRVTFLVWLVRRSLREEIGRQLLF